jgi:hypothetical protein
MRATLWQIKHLMGEMLDWTTPSPQRTTMACLHEIMSGLNGR